MSYDWIESKRQGRKHEYRDRPLTELMAGDEPFGLFKEWFDEAMGADLVLPEAMTLATADDAGRPSARVVLLKLYDEEGFVFFTNYESRKGRELSANPHAALTFWWGPLEREIRIEGDVERVSDEMNDAYFETRDRGSQLGAHASRQSSRVADEEALKASYAAASNRFDDDPVERPASWGGYRVRPTSIEYWQGRPSRMHDRIVFRKTDDGWMKERLAP